MNIRGRHYTDRNMTFVNCFCDKKLQSVYPRNGKPANFESVFFDLAETNVEIWYGPRELLHWHLECYQLVKGELSVAGDKAWNST
jgi:hypothetical protein